MATREQGLRRTAALTAGVAAAGIVGSVAIGLTAYAQDRAGSSETAADSAGSISAKQDATTSYPSVSSAPNTAQPDAESSGS